MAAKTKIEWTGRTWNPATGCTKISQGCKNCYALAIAERFRGGKAWPNGFDLQLRPERLAEPQKWKAPQTVFVCSMSDLFQVGVPTEFIQQVWEVMRETPQHTYQILTKRPERMAELSRGKLPLLPNVWLGTSVELMRHMDRLHHLVGSRAAVRFVSAEPLLDDCMQYLNTWVQPGWIHWVIFGGESGPGARVCHEEWVRKGILSARSIGALPFVKQLGSVYAKTNRLSHSKAGDPSEWPVDLQIREMPGVIHGE